jgi:fibronectin-binding autotransporter adhesin
MMYPVNVARGRKARRFSAVATAAGACAIGLGWWSEAALGATEKSWIGGGLGGSNWSTTVNWNPTGQPAAGNVADVFKSGSTASYNLGATSPDLLAVQVAGNTSTGTAVLSMGASSYLDTGSLYVGAGVTGQNGYNSSIGYGQVIQNQGTISIDPGGVVEIDSNSSYTLSGTGSLSAYNEQNAGTFSHSGGTNVLGSGSTLSNSGTYILSSTATLSVDSTNNTGTFNQQGGTIQGATSANTTFTNNGTFIYSAGSFIGSIINDTGAIITTTSASIPFTGTLLNNGKITVTNATGNFNASIGGSGILLFTGTSSAVTLTGTDSFTGQTTVAAGTLNLNSPVGIASNNFGGALQGSVIVATGATLVNEANLQIADTSSLTINGGTYNISNHDQTVGSLTMNSGLVMETTGLGLGVASGSVTLVKDTSATITGGLRTNGTYTFNVGSSATLNVIGTVGGYNTASAALIMTGGGTLSLSGASPLSNIDVKSGTVGLSESGTLGGVNVATAVETGGTLSLTNQSLTIGDLTGGGAIALGTGALTVNSTGSTFPGTLAGSGSVIKAGPGTLTLTGADSSSGLTDVLSGNLTVANSGSISGSSIFIQSGAVAAFNGAINNSPNLTVSGSLVFGANPNSGILIRNTGVITVGTNTGGGNGQVQIAAATNHADRTLLINNGIALAGTTNAWTGLLDLTNNDMDITGSVLPTVENEVATAYANGTWKGNGISSSTAAADTTHLTAVGAILNNDGFGNPIYGSGTTLGLFDGYNPSTSDILVKYTYYGDANLDGKIDGSDYSRIDNGFLLHLTGWYNGDFNYDGVINGSDYTLMDNAFNQQGAALSAEVASSTAQVAQTASVPEPESLGLIAVAAAASLKRRRSSIRR